MSRHAKSKPRITTVHFVLILGLAFAVFNVGVAVWHIYAMNAIYGPRRTAAYRTAIITALELKQIPSDHQSLA